VDDHGRGRGGGKSVIDRTSTKAIYLRFEVPPSRDRGGVGVFQTNDVGQEGVSKNSLFGETSLMNDPLNKY